MKKFFVRFNGDDAREEVLEAVGGAAVREEIGAAAEGGP